MSQFLARPPARWTLVISAFVEGIRTSNAGDIWSMVKEALGAELHKPNGGSHSFGLKHPSIPNAYVQIDVELSLGNDTKDGAELFEWTRFIKGDGDLLQLIGVVHRGLGITSNDRGMHIRVEEVEVYDRKKSMIFLTRDPNQVMNFYGLDKTKYWKGFSDETDLFNWIASGRYFYWKEYETDNENSNDRSRMAKRPMFRRFVQEYMSGRAKLSSNNDGTNGSDTENDEPSPDTATRPSRQRVLKNALDMFEKHEEYNAIILEHETKGVEDALWKQLLDIIPAPQSTTFRGLKRYVMFKDGQPYINHRPPKSLKLKWTEYIKKEAIPDLLAWVGENREEIRNMEESRAEAARRANVSRGGN